MAIPDLHLKERLPGILHRDLEQLRVTQSEMPLALPDARPYRGRASFPASWVAVVVLCLAACKRQEVPERERYLNDRAFRREVLEASLVNHSNT